STNPRLMTLRLLSRGLQTVLDIVVLSVAYWLAFLFRFEFSIPSMWLRVLLTTWPYVVALQYGGLVLFGGPRMSWRYISIGDVGRILVAVATSSSLMTLVRLVGPSIDAGIAIVIIPLGVLAMTVVLAFMGLVGVRAARRLQGEASDRRRQASGDELH